MFNILANAVEKVDVKFIDTLIKRGYILRRNEQDTRSISVRDIYVTPYLIEQLSYFRDILSILNVITTREDNAKQVYTDLDFQEPKKHSAFLQQVYYSSRFTCKNLLRKCYYPYEDEIKDFFLKTTILF